MEKHEYRGSEFEQQASLDALIDDVRVANELIANDELSPQDIKELIREFDSRWPFMNSEIIIYGPCYMPILSTEKQDLGDNEEDLSKFLLTDFRKRAVLGGDAVTSHGFHIVPTEDGDEIILWIQTKKLCEQVQVSPLQTINFINFGFARVDEVKFVPRTETPEMREQKMRFTYGDLMEDIDDAALNSTSLTGALRSVGAVRKLYLGEEDHAATLIEIGQYIHRLFDFDPNMPYIIKTYDGEATATKIAYVISVDWIVWGDETKYLSPFLRVNSIEESGDLKEMLIDPEAVVDILHLKDLPIS